MALQDNLVWQNPQANRLHFGDAIHELLSEKTADLVVLPEMFTSGFSMTLDHVDVLNESGMSDTSTWMLNLAKQHGVAITGSFGVRDTCGATYNRMWFATPEGDLHHYDKRHLFTLAGEPDAYTRGSSRVEVLWRGWRILLQICYDLRFPSFARNHGSQPYDLAIYVANWPKSRSESWRTLLQARAIENQCHVIGVNRCGSDENGHHYSGDSLIVDHSGSVLADAGATGQPVALRASLKHDDMMAYRRKLPFLEDADRFGIR